MIEIMDFWDESKTCFGPKYKYTICNANIEGDMTSLIEEITSRDEASVNLMEFNDTTLVIDAIKDMHRCYLIAKEEEELDKIYIKSEVCLQKKGEKYVSKVEGDGNTLYLSGQIILQQENTNTYYTKPYVNNDDISYKIEDKCNAITIFPSWVKHYTDRVFTDTARIAVNFTIITPESFALHIPAAKKQMWTKL